MSRITQTNRYQQTAIKPRFSFKGVYVVRLLVGFLLALNVVLILTILFSPKGVLGYRKQNQQVRELEEKVLKLRVENQKLFEMIQSLKTSPIAREKFVRQELGWIGEKEIVLEPSEKESEGAEKPVGPIKPFSFPKN